ncbi:MAG: polysaccharide biosynthesis/export family protein, partial [Bacteroidales bacterium]|nr:polysaccharide biosynthesis/export family protein [Bacteroidales bacterium]
MKNLIKLFVSAFVLLTVFSCAAPKKVAYFQDTKEEGYTPVKVTDLAIRFRPGDEVSIIVNCKEPALTNLFNLPYTSQRLGDMTGNTSNMPQGISGYVLDVDGNVDFPVIGKLNLLGRSREEVEDLIKDELVSRNLVKDPVVTVKYMNLGVSVMGDVGHPGRYP